MATTASVHEVRQQMMSAEDLRLRRLWGVLPADRPVPEEEAYAAILEAAGRHTGDDAWASAHVAMLAAMGAVKAPPGGPIERSAEFPILPDLVPGTQAYMEVRDRGREEMREREVESENRAARRRFEESPEGRQRRETEELIDELVALTTRRVVRSTLEDLLDGYLDRPTIERALKGLDAAA